MGSNPTPSAKPKTMNEKNNLRQLPSRISFELLEYPETGTGYQVVIFRLKDGTLAESVVYNQEFTISDFVEEIESVYEVEIQIREQENGTVGRKQ